jgi:hypothetical protein
MPANQYHYFISYQYRTKDENGFGQLTLLLNDRVAGPDHIDAIIEHLTDKFKFDNVVIINLILLKEEEI